MHKNKNNEIDMGRIVKNVQKEKKIVPNKGLRTYREWVTLKVPWGWIKSAFSSEVTIRGCNSD